MTTSYEASPVEWGVATSEERDPGVCAEIVRYGGFLVRRGLISNSFGNIAVRVRTERHPLGVLYTKPRGISLEECRPEDIVGTSVESNVLLFGDVPPSNGHQMSREVMRLRPDVDAVIHTHANAVCAYFAVRAHGEFRYVGNDTALVLGAAPRILPQHINLEADASAVEEFVRSTSCLIMPHHGLVTLGRTLSEAYHRHTAVVAEVERVMIAQRFAAPGEMPYLDDAEIQELYGLGDAIVYGRR